MKDDSLIIFLVLAVIAIAALLLVVPLNKDSSNNNVEGKNVIVIEDGVVIGEGVFIDGEIQTVAKDITPNQTVV